MVNIQSTSRQLLRASMSENTHTAYRTALSAFNRFRDYHQLSNDWPANSQQVVLFVASCFEKGFSSSTICSYCSGISFHHKINSWIDPTDTFIVKKLLEGCRRSRCYIDNRAPITKQILQNILKALTDICYGDFECKLFAAAYSLAYFGLFRVSELAFTSASQSDRPLQYSDILYKKDKTAIFVQIRRSKTNQAGKPIKICIQKSAEDELCCIKHMTAYLQLRPKHKGYLFCHQNKSPLTRYQFSSILAKAIRKLGLPGYQFKTHSFRIGRATDLAKSGFSADAIKKAGRWSSDNYAKYIRI